MPKAAQVKSALMVNHFTPVRRQNQNVIKKKAAQNRGSARESRRQEDV